MSRSKQTVGVVLVAAGRGRRFASLTHLPKQFVPLAGRPLLFWSLQTFEKTPSVDSICVVVPKGHERRTETLIRRWRLRKVKAVIAGGAERADSVRLGLRALPPTEIVLVHDAARPLVTRDVVERVIAGARRTGAALAAWPVSDTLKQSKNSAAYPRVAKTIPRAGLWLAQTPQGFRHDVAHEVLPKMNSLLTDDVQAAEKAGRPVELVAGSSRNLKVTLPDDIKICEALLKTQSRKTFSSPLGTAKPSWARLRTRSFAKGGGRG